VIKFLNILSQVLTEAKRYRFTPETLDRINKIVDRLWSDRKKDYQRRKEFVGIIPIKLANGVDGLVRVYVNPRLSYIGSMDSKPSKSIDPADIIIEVNPKFYESKKNLYLTVYHELLHASDPTQSVNWSPKYEMGYDQTTDEKYWGHPIEFFAISNEFLEGLVNEFKRRVERFSIKDNSKSLHKSLQNILNYFAKNEPLTKQSLNIIQRINDENIGSNRLSQTIADIQTDFPNTSDIFPPLFEDEPYYLYYVQMIKQYNPEIWKKLLSMLYTTSKEIEEIIDTKKRGLK